MIIRRAESHQDSTIVGKRCDVSHQVFVGIASCDRSNIGAQTYVYNGLGDRVRVSKPTGTRHFVYDSQGRGVVEFGASASDVEAEFIWALPPAAANPEARPTNTNS